VALALTLRQRWPQLPVVLITGYSTALGAVSDFTVLRKPCAPDTLVAALIKAIDEMQAAVVSST
jgi:DNA-binding NtrC family response regulator